MGETTVFQQVAEAIGAADSVMVPKIIEALVDEKEAGLVMAASPPATIEELAEKTGIPVAEVEGMIDSLFKKGLIFKSKKPDATRYYRVRHLLQFHDATILAPDATEDFFDLWREYHKNEFKADHKKIESALPASVVRVIPVNLALEPDTRIAPFEDVKRIVADARILAVTPCTCRVVEGDCGKTVEVCIQINKAADYALERGSGRALPKDEAIEMLKQCEEEGLVHTVGNSRGLGHIICNCCQDCCINWPGPRNPGINFAAPSRFTAVVDEDLCTACEECLDRCYFDAIAVNDTAEIDEEKCMGCGLCAVTCSVEAISLKEIRKEEFVPE
ncbi:MAG: 4Fe-4S binding protein [Deltaproteobacteria bacterium]|nr:4Fe-4S binding protein [Deltaproteobacteria bacterium]